MIELRANGYNIKLNIFNFPVGESSIKLDHCALNKHTRETNTVVIDFKYESDAELIHLAMVVNAIRSSTVLTKVKLKLNMHYVPYSRQDRVCNKGESLSIKVLANFINSLEFDQVVTLDNHSDVSTALLNNCANIPVSSLVFYLLNSLNKDNLFLVSPDAGANKKVFEIAKEHKLPMLRADKSRDTATGKITGTKVYTDEYDVSTKDMLVIDDICDGGYTFISLAKELRKITTGKLSLYVTHGMFTKGIEELLEHYDTVYTANTKVFNERLLKVKW